MRQLTSESHRHALTTSAQLRDEGWTEAEIRTAASRGRRCYPGVLVGHRGPLSPVAQRRAAWLWAGPSTVLTGVAVLVARGLRPSSDGESFTFLTSRTSRARSWGAARTLRSTRVEAEEVVDGVPVVPLCRAVADAGRLRQLPPTKLRGLALSLLQRGLVDAPSLEDELLRGGRRGTAEVRAALRDFREGAWSVPEAVLAEVVARCPGLPPMLPNARLVTKSGQLLGTPDGYFPDAGVAVQVHSKEFHSGVDAAGTALWVSTVEKDQRMAAAGVVVVAVTPTTLRRNPRAFLDALVSTVRVHTGRPPLDRAVEGR